MSDSDDAWWQAELDRNGSVTFPARRGRAAGLLFLALAFSAEGLVLIVTGSIVKIVVGVMAVAFFGALGVPVALARLVTGKPIVRVDRQGLIAGGQQVAWTEVTGVKTWGRSGTTMVVIYLSVDAARRVRSGLNPLQRVVEPANRKVLGGPSMYLPTTNGFKAEVMAAWLNRVWTVSHGN